MQTRAEAAEKELAHVKEKAWKIMEEKDAQLKAARVSASQMAHLVLQTIRACINVYRCAAYL